MIASATSPKPHRVEKHWGVEWLRKNGKDGENPYYIVLQNAKPGDITVTCEFKKSHLFMYSNLTVQELKKVLAKNRYAYEIIRADAPRKAFFDIDCDIPKDTGAEECELMFSELQSKLKTKVTEIFGDTRIFLSGSVGNKDECIRLSLHVVLGDVVYDSHEHMKDSNFDSVIDVLGADLGVKVDKIYTRNRLFKLPGQSKLGSDRVQAILDGSSVEDHFVTGHMPEKWTSKTFTANSVAASPTKLSLVSQASPKSKPQSSFSSGSISPISGATIPYDWSIEGDPLKTLEILHHDFSNHRLPHNLIYSVMSWCVGRGVHFSSFYAWVSRGREDCNATRVKYAAMWKDLNHEKIASNKTISIILQQMYPDAIFEDRETREMIDYLRIVPTTTLKIEEEIDGTQRRPELKLFAQKNNVVLDLPMGIGKTISIIHHMLENEKMGRRTLIITCRCTLVKDMLAVAKRMGSKLNSYSETPSPELCDSLIIQQESMYKLETAKAYDSVIVDEMESLLNQSASTETHGLRLTRNIASMIGLLKSASKTIFADAVTTQKTIRFLHNIGIEDLDIVHCKGFQKSMRTVHFVQAGSKANGIAHKMAQMIGEKIKKGENAFVYYPYAKSKYNDKGILTRFGIQDFAKLVENYSGLSTDSILAFYGEMDDEACSESLMDVNMSWSFRRVVITTSKITVGVSFETTHFHSVFIAKSPNCSPRNIIQTSCRPRSLVNNTVYVFQMPGKVNQQPIENLLDQRSPYFETYRALLADVQYERDNCDMNAFKLFIDRVGYRVGDDITLQSSPGSKAREIESNNDYAWDAIPDLFTEEAEDTETKVRARCATNIEKISYKKHAFKRLFYKDSCDEMAKQLWDDGHVDVAWKTSRFKNEYGHNLRSTITSIVADDILEKAAGRNLDDDNPKTLFGNVPDFSSDERTRLGKMIIGASCFTSSRSSKEKRINSFFELAFGIPVLCYSKAKHKWVLKTSNLKTIISIFKAVRGSEESPVHLPEYAFIGL